MGGRCQHLNANVLKYLHSVDQWLTQEHNFCFPKPLSLKRRRVKSSLFVAKELSPFHRKAFTLRLVDAGGPPLAGGEGGGRWETLSRPINTFYGDDEDGNDFAFCFCTGFTISPKRLLMQLLISAS